MANQKEIEAQYDYFGAIHELRLESPTSTRDYTCALFDGDKSLTLDEAQKKKHEWVMKGINFKSGDKVLDIGCGWGPIIETVTKSGGKAVGLTLSPHQVNYCKRRGFDVRLRDYKTIKKGELGIFDSIVSIGAFEHFCSLEEFKEGKQEKIYGEFFKFCADNLKKGGKLYLQTMTWGDNTPQANTADFNPNVGAFSKEATIFRLCQFYPGSWLPSGLKQMVNSASKYFTFKESKNGREDYIITLDRWGENSKRLLLPNKLLRTISLSSKILFKAIYNKNMRYQISSILHNDQQRCFQNNWMSHERMFFEKK